MVTIKNFKNETKSFDELSFGDIFINETRDLCMKIPTVIIHDEEFNTVYLGDQDGETICYAFPDEICMPVDITITIE